MAVKKSQSRVSSAKKNGFKFRWWMAVIGILFVAVIGIIVVRLSFASGGTSAPKGPLYMIGDSLSTGLVFEGALNQKLQTAGYSPAVVNANPGRSITAGGFDIDPDPNRVVQQDAIQAVDADNKNICPTTTDATIKVYCQSHNNQFNPVKDAKTIVLALGTNAESNQAGFDVLQQQFIGKIKGLNPSARLVWVDVAAPGNKAVATNQDALNFARLANPNITVNDLINQFNQTRTRLANTQNVIYANSSKLNYSVLSQFKLVWPQFGSPTTDFSKITDQRDSNGFTVDGTHYTRAGSQAFADFIVSALSQGTFTQVVPSPPGNTPQVTSPGTVLIPLAITAPVTIDLVNPPNYVAEKQQVTRPNLPPPLRQNELSRGCVKQVNTIKNTVSFEGCKVDASSQIQLTANEGYKKDATGFKFAGQKLQVCLTSKTTNKSQPATVTFMKNNQPVAIVPTTHGSGSELAELITCGTSTVGISEAEMIVITSTVETVVGKLILTNVP